MDETVIGDGPTEIDGGAAAGAYSHPYDDATSGAEPGEQRVLATRFEELEEFKRRDVCAKVPANEAPGETGGRVRKAHLCATGGRKQM